MLRSRLAPAVAFAFAVAAGAAAPTAGPAAPVPKHLMPKHDLNFYATRAGDRLEHLSDESTVVYIVTGVETKKEGLQVRVEQESREGNRIHGETVILSERGVKVTEYNGKTLDPPFWWVKLPHVENNSWPDKFGDQTWTGKTVGWEDVEVPAGKFRALHVQHVEPEPRGTTSYWFALGTGCVKWESASGKRELTSFKPGK